jgi:thioredoxin family protein
MTMRQRTFLIALTLVPLASTRALAAETLRCEIPIAAPTPLADSTLVRLFDSGRTYKDLASKPARWETEWKEGYSKAQIPAALIARARAVKGMWRVLVVAEDWCSDSANNLPFIARLLDSVPNVQMRIVDTTHGGAIMRAHRTWDGRAATPTIVLIDAAGNEVGCFIERPMALQAFLKRDPPLTHDQTSAEKRPWYVENKGAETLREFVEMLEGAASGAPKCAVR